MFPRLAGVTILCAALAPAAAIAQSAKPDTSGNANASQSSQPLPQQIQQKLTSQGFSDVKVVPGSFLVSAKDKQGDPVTMIIGPHSMTMFTFSTSGDSTVGSGARQSGQSGSK